MQCRQDLRTEGAASRENVEASGGLVNGNAPFADVLRKPLSDRAD
jgi:hypothetical protein